MTMTVRDVMTRPVFTVGPETPLKRVAELLVEHGISGLPVVGPDREVLGVISEADFLAKEQGAGRIRHRRLARLLGETPETQHQLATLAAETAGAAMSSPPITIPADRSVGEAATLMIDRRVNRLPVTDAGVLVGIVTRADLIRAFLRSDEQLAETIREEVLRRTLWLDPAAFVVSVVDGVARVAGRVERRSTADTIDRVIAMVPGVIGVESALEWDLDDREIVAPDRDLVSPFVAPRTH